MAKLSQDDFKSICSTFDISARGCFHDIYSKLGLVRQRNGNFECPNKAGHMNGTDRKASVSICNDTGKGHCFTCHYKFNLQSYWKEYQHGPFVNFMIEYLGIDKLNNVVFSGDNGLSDQDRENLKAIGKFTVHDLFDKVFDHYTKEHGSQPTISRAMQETIRESVVDAIPMEIIDNAVKNLLADDATLLYLKNERKITPDIIEKYRIGMDTTSTGGRRILFPQFDATGMLMNIKAYQPWSPNYKWTYPFKDRGDCKLPTPLKNLTDPKIYFFEGDPDAYCAIGFGFAGAVTMGSSNNVDVVASLGEDEARQLFTGKEIVICMDADEPGRIAAKTLADQLHAYAKQVKVVDLDKSDINPHGLDPAAVKEYEGDDGVKKVRRSEKDFTDFMKKNGFGVEACSYFIELENATNAYVKNEDRVSVVEYNVTLQESRSPKYASSSDKIHLKLRASVVDVDDKAYQVPKQISASCTPMYDDSAMGPICRGCMLKKHPEFFNASDITLDVTHERTRANIQDRTKVVLTYHQVLGLIEVSESQREKNLKKFCGIPERCGMCTLIAKGVPNKLTHIRLGREINEYVKNGSPDMYVDAYILNRDMLKNHTYNFKCVQTTSWSGQYAILYIEEVEPVLTSIEMFKITDDVVEILKVFKPDIDETVESHLARRYEVFGNMAGMNGRSDMFFVNDLAFFSAIELRNKMLPEIHRGWVEVLIAGETRCGKTVVTNFLREHYKFGDFVAGSSGVTAAGLIGGVTKFNGGNRISWGRFAVNDGGLVVIDEMSDIRINLLNDLKDLRSGGYVHIAKIEHGTARAMCRKIFLSNPRVNSDGAAYTDSDKKNGEPGIIMLMELCGTSPVLSRFDVAHVVRTSDVNLLEFKSSYQSSVEQFTSYQCQKLLQWAYSRTPDEVIYEDGFDDMINNMQIELNNMFHASTQLINHELRAKVIRMSISVASMTFSIPPNGDVSKIYVKKEHALVIRSFLIREYSKKSMGILDYSESIKRSETLGNMRFMVNILKYVSVNTVMLNNEFSENDIGSIYSDYLTRTLFNSRRLMMVDGISDDNKSFCDNIHTAQKKFVGLLLSRNCIYKSRYKYSRTPQFTDWLQKYDRGEIQKEESILEPHNNELSIKDIKGLEEFVDANQVVRNQSANRLGSVQQQKYNIAS